MHYNHQYRNYQDPGMGRIPVQDFPVLGTWTQATIGFLVGAAVGPAVLKMFGIKF